MISWCAERVSGINRDERNRSRLALLRSLQEPHPDSLVAASLGLQAWGEELGDGDRDLLDQSAGIALDWAEVKGWQESGPCSSAWIPEHRA